MEFDFTTILDRHGRDHPEQVPMESDARAYLSLAGTTHLLQRSSPVQPRSL